MAQNHPLKTVEPIATQFVKNLQERGYVVCGLTARERKQWYDTHQEDVDRVTNVQLMSVDINFNNQSLENTYPYLALASEYFDGTFFANTDSKGNYLINLFKDAPELPIKIVFIDDKLTQVESVAKALADLGIENESYFYYATDAKAKLFNPLIANIQLYHFLNSKYQKILSDEAAALLAEEDPTRDAEYYLKAILAIAHDL